MNRWKLGALALIVFFGTACQQSGNSEQASPAEESTAQNQLPPNAASFTLPRPGAKTEVDEAGKVIHKASPAGFLANGIWHCTGKMAKQDDKIGADASCEGMWMKFEDEGSFSTGHYDQTERTGQWAFGDNVIELIYSDEADRLYGYRIQHGSNAMIFLGNARYQTNPTQMKLERYDSYPVMSPDAGSVIE